VNFTVNVDTEGLDLTTVVGRRRVRDEDGDWTEDDETLGDVLVAELLRQVMKNDDWRGVKGLVKQIREEEVRAAVQREIAEALTTTVPITNTYGEPTGQTTTIRALIADMAKDALTKPADRYGSGESAVRQVLRKQVDVALAAELLAVVKEERAKVVATIRGHAAEIIAKTLEQGLGGR
jgi:hypothetical protein